MQIARNSPQHVQLIIGLQDRTTVKIIEMAYYFLNYGINPIKVLLDRHEDNYKF